MTAKPKIDLFDVSIKYSQAFAILDDLSEAEATEEEMAEAMSMIDKIEGNFTDKIASMIAYAKNCEAEAKAIKDAIDKMSIRQKALNNKSERIRERVIMAMDIAAVSKVKCPQFEVSVRPSSRGSVVIEEGTVLPPEYQVVKPAEPNKTLIGDALKKGLVVEGCSLKFGVTLTVR
jgi:hypothetical protein